MVQMYARVIVDIANANVDRLFDYTVPDDLVSFVGPGIWVKVPFANRFVEGFILSLSEETDIPQYRLRPLHSVLDEQPILTQELINIAIWMKERYRCRLVDGLRVAIPAQFRTGRVKQAHQSVLSLSGSLQDTQEALNLLGANASRQRAVLTYLIKHKGRAYGNDIAAATGANSTVFKALEKRKLVVLASERVERQPYEDMAPDIKPPPQLTSMQQQAVERISQGIRAQVGRFLIHGVTGSGKTEIYMRCASLCLERGQSVIILVPEISLTPQMMQRFISRFGSQAAVIHSRLSPGERLDQWDKIRTGQARVVIGARSAVFAPVRDLGLIVVDEEHESSYRSESVPRYDALEVADFRCRQEGAVLVTGSATPSVERYYAAENERWTILNLPERIGGRPMPKVDIVDMRAELARGNRSILSANLYRELHRCIVEGEQAILFLNRRGHSNFVSCRSCGYVCKCENCDISLTYHNSDENLKCHYCGTSYPVPKVCPSCGSTYIRYFGTGTQKVEQEIKRLFPQAKVLRMDADTTKGKDGHLNILEAFRKREAQILIGTQMIAKGLDFPMVTLVGVIAADLSLHVPDYRSSERTFQLVAQVIGRAGRDLLAGRAVIQTYSPDHYSIESAAHHDYQFFYEQEISFRKRNQFPPFARFIRVLFSHPKEEVVLAEAEQFNQNVKEAIAANPTYQPSILLHESTPAPVTRIEGRYRHQIIFKILPRPFGAELESLIQDTMEAMVLNCLVSIENNPINMV